MYRLSTTVAVLVLLAGCAASPPRSAAFVAGQPALTESTPAVATIAPSKTINLNKFASETICEDVRRPYSRIVTGQRCYTRDANDAVEEARREVARLQFEDVRRQYEALEQVRQMQERQRQLAMREAMLRNQRR